MKSHQLINQDSGIVEYYTPQFIIDAARATMGSIDLDPASSELANKRIGATRIFTQSDDGLMWPWTGNVWLNHPFGRVRNVLWISKLVYEFSVRSEPMQACCITFAATSEKWFQPLMQFPICFLSPRTNYYLPDGSTFRGATKGSCVTYLGTKPWLFKAAFEKYGTIKI